MSTPANNPQTGYESDLDDPLLRNLMALGEPAGVVDGEAPAGGGFDTGAPDAAAFDADAEPGEELFELFLEGRLQGEDREQFLRFLDANPGARAATSEYLNFLEAEAEAEAADPAPATLSITRQSQQSWASPARWGSVVVALAACLLLAVGLWQTTPGGLQVAENRAYDQASALVAESEFEQAERVIEAALQDGVDSPRLSLLAARASMQEPAPLTSPDAWSLRRFDYEFDGTLIMDGEVSEEAVDRLTKAEAIVDAVDPAEQLARLSRGWLLLKRNRPADAAEVFRGVLDAQPLSEPRSEPRSEADIAAAAAMGLGVAEFMIGGDRLDAAEAAFRKLLDARPESLAGRLNLAMCLAEAGKIAESLAEWRKVDLAKLPADEQAAAADAIAMLEAGLAAQQDAETDAGQDQE
ncbi:MAG: hypothetical protein AAF790_07885 [Planctomycetota bacterium]